MYGNAFYVFHIHVVSITLQCLGVLWNYN